MAALYYLDEFEATEIVEELTQGLFPGTRSFQLNGEPGRDRLLSALGQVRWPRYRTLQHKAAALHYFLNRDHPYLDGNKRFAVAAMEVFLFLNGAALMATEDEVRDFALGVAKGEISLTGSFQFLSLRTIRQYWTIEQLSEWARRLPPNDLRIVEACWGTDAPVRWERVEHGVDEVLARMRQR